MTAPPSVRPAVRPSVRRSAPASALYDVPGPKAVARTRLYGVLALLAIAALRGWVINEAFAVVPLQTIKKLGIDPARVNVNGGAIALGHPLGATGAILLGSAVDELERSGKATALATLCIGGGMGIATVIERV